jgi:hypothetical protein
MSRKTFIIILVVVILALYLFVPIPEGVYQDGGTKVYSARVYKIVVWNKVLSNGTYEKTVVYWFPYNYCTIDELWLIEQRRS